MSDFRKQFNLLKFHTKLYLAGLYFTLTGSKYRTEGLELLIPNAATDIRFRGQFPIDFYEKQERRYLKEYLPQDATVLELGGCLGVVSCLANKRLAHPECHVVVEANPHLIQYIEANRAHNGCGFAIENCVVSERPSMEFFIGNTILMSSIRRPTGTKIKVPGKTITDLEQAHNLRFDTLIMDIEGGELDLLRENREKLRQINLVFIEVHPHPEILSEAEVAECLTILEAAGLKRVVNDTSFWVLKRAA